MILPLKFGTAREAMPSNLELVRQFASLIATPLQYEAKQDISL